MLGWVWLGCVSDGGSGIQIGAEGTPTASEYAGRAPGRVWLVPWPPSAEDISLAAADSVTGAGEDQVGAWVRALPDLDGDGAAELMWLADHEGNGDWPPGVTHLRFSGGGEAQILADAELPGDVTGDGRPDVTFARDNNSSDLSLQIIDGASVVSGARLGLSDVGWSVSPPPGQSLGARAIGPAGDLDGDGGTDLLVGLSGYYADPRVALIRSSTLVPGDRPLADPVIGGVDDGADLGFQISDSPLGDVTGDGVPDVILGDPVAPGSDGWGVGAAGVFSGAAWTADLAFDAPWTRLEGLWIADEEPHGEQFAEVVTVLGDLDGDGRAEVACASDRVSGSGVTYVFTGATLAAGGVVSAAAAWFETEERLTPAPDLDGDGAPEVVAVSRSGASAEVWSGADLPVVTALGRVDTSALTWGTIAETAFVADGLGGYTWAIGTPVDFLVD